VVDRPVTDDLIVVSVAKRTTPFVVRSPTRASGRPVVIRRGQTDRGTTIAVNAPSVVTGMRVRSATVTVLRGVPAVLSAMSVPRGEETAPSVPTGRSGKSVLVATVSAATVPARLVLSGTSVPAGTVNVPTGTTAPNVISGRSPGEHGSPVATGAVRRATASARSAPTGRSATPSAAIVTSVRRVTVSGRSVLTARNGMSVPRATESAPHASTVHNGPVLVMTVVLVPLRGTGTSALRVTASVRSVPTDPSVTSVRVVTTDVPPAGTAVRSVTSAPAATEDVPPAAPPSTGEASVRTVQDVVLRDRWRTGRVRTVPPGRPGRGSPTTSPARNWRRTSVARSRG
jgi:hypothetical protein